MSACMKRNSELLKVLAKCKPKLRQAILKAAEDDLFEAIRQCLLNVWFETVKLKPKTAKKLDHILRILNLLPINEIPSHIDVDALFKKERVFYPFYLQQFVGSWLTFYNGTRQTISARP